jgi:hypothetical protein
MLIDIVKLFPKSCSLNGVRDLVFESSSITNISIDSSQSPTEYIIQLDKIEYRFSSIDNEADGAIEALAGIRLCENGPSLFKNLHKAMNIAPDKNYEELMNLNRKTLEFYRSKYEANNRKSSPYNQN